MSKQPEADDQNPEKKSSQQLLSLLLLLLIILFAYLYFFTGVIRPRENQPPPPPPAPEPLVKKPLPPRLDQGGAKSTAGAGKPAAAGKGQKGGALEGKEAKPAPAAEKGEPQAKPAAASGPAGQVAKPAQVKAVKAPAPAAPATPAKAGKPEAAKEGAKGGSAEKKGVPKEAKPAASAEKKPAVEAKRAATKTVEKTPAAKVAAAVYLLEVKGDLPESEVAAVAAKLKRAGIGHLVKTREHKSEPMHRLFLADFASRDEATEEFQRLKLTVPDAFMLQEKGRYAVYAGSYLREAKAVVEQERLRAKGVQLLLKSATVAVPVVRLRAGSFADRASADRAAKALEKNGLKLSVVKVGK